MRALVAVSREGEDLILVVDDESRERWQREFDEADSTLPRDIGLKCPDEPGIYAWGGEAFYGDPYDRHTGEVNDHWPEWRGTWTKATAYELRQFQNGADPWAEKEEIS